MLSRAGLRSAERGDLNVPKAQYVSDLHPKFALRPKVWQTSNLRWLRLGEEKRKRKKKEERRRNYGTKK